MSSRVIFADDDYKILQRKGDFVLVNRHGDYENHGHFRKKKTCFLLMRLMREKKVPFSKYLQGSVLRISLDEDYKSKVKRRINKMKNKQKYININKGC
jgi:hypothetical protein